MAASSLLRSAGRYLRRPSILEEHRFSPRLIENPRRFYSATAAAGPQGPQPNKHSTAQPEMGQQVKLVGVKNKAQGSDCDPLSMELTNLNRTVQEMKQKLDILCELQQERSDELWRPIWFFAILGVIVCAKT